MFCSPPRYNLKISIHALLAESDRTGAPQLVVVSTFLSTLSLRRATMLTSPPSAKVFKFLSTLSLRRATTRSKRIILNQIFLSTLSLRRATGAGTVVLLVLDNFYPRSPCGERRVSVGRHSPSFYFYPRSPCGERPPIWGAAPAPATHFYPRSPCGERLVWVVPHACKQNFYPRSPCGERLRGSAPRPAPR